MSESFRIRLDKEHHVFAAAHFITFAGDICERLHGHNYRVAVELAGPLDDNSYVVGFIATYAVMTDDASILTAALVLGLVAFLGTVAFARYLEEAVKR